MRVLAQRVHAAHHGPWSQWSREKCAQGYPLPTFTIAGTGPGKKVIHAVGPDLREVEAHDTAGALRTLSDAYMNVLREFALCGETRCPPPAPPRAPAHLPRGHA